MSTLYHRKERKSMIKINELQLENVKRIKAVKLEPAQNGLLLSEERTDRVKLLS